MTIKDKIGNKRTFHGNGLTINTYISIYLNKINFTKEVENEKK